MERSTFKSLLLICTAFASLSSFANNEAAIKVNWNYTGATGPQFWGTLDPTFQLCAKGKKQSPIDIPAKTIKEDNGLLIHYQSAPLEIVDDGTTTLQIGNSQTVINDGHTVQLNFTDDQEFITINAKNYRLVQFHVHSPSENKWQTKSYPLEIHFVHQGKSGTLAVIGVFVKTGAENTTLQKIIKNFPKDEGTPEVIQGQEINPIHLLPPKHHYYQFKGSLTTPPCAEGVEWIVMSEPITASPAQIAALRKEINGMNARPTQPLNGREVLYSEEN